jgi:hypothetical protein
VAGHVEREGGHASWDAKEVTVTHLVRGEQPKPFCWAIGDRDDWDSRPTCHLETASKCCHERSHLPHLAARERRTPERPGWTRCVFCELGAFAPCVEFRFASMWNAEENDPRDHLQDSAVHVLVCSDHGLIFVTNGTCESKCQCEYSRALAVGPQSRDRRRRAYPSRCVSIFPLSR